MAVLIVAGALANKPNNGGEAWVRLNWVLGLRQLGHEVYFVEQVAPAMAVHRSYFTGVTDRFGLSHASALLSDDGAGVAGLDTSRLRDVARAADAVINISGHLRVPWLLEHAPRRVYVDIDPGFTQVWHAQGADLGLERHNSHYTIGWQIGTADCPIPTGGFDWRRVRPPVVLERWPVAAPARDADQLRFTTIASWRASHGSLHWDGVTYGLKLHEFRKLIDLPRRLPRQQFELALQIYAGDDADRRALLGCGWQLVAPDVAATPEDFRRYVADSGGEFSAAQGVYVHMNSGWFSDRTAAYLASGRPALVQDTGLAASGVPCGVGLVPFRTVDDAAAGAADIAADYDRHRAAARRIAEEHFDSGRVLGRLLTEIGVTA